MKTYCFLPVLMLTLQIGGGLSVYPAPTTVCPVAKCALPDPNNPCRNECRRDGQCGFGGKCCPLCGCNRCIGGTPRETCATKVCRDGQVCVEGDCDDGDCGRARCVPQPLIKPGLCPIAAKFCVIETNPVCPERQCIKDSQCRGVQKCCLDCDGCVLCRDPISG